LPEESPFRPSVLVQYHFLVAAMLAEPPTGRKVELASVICLPSFRPEWIVRILDKKNGRFAVLLTEAEEHIWGAYWHKRDPREIKVRRKQATLDPELARRLVDAWRRMLVGVRHRRQDRMGLDGVNYHFACLGFGCETLSGRTWSPPPESPAGRLVALSESLREYAESKCSRLAEAGERIGREVARLEDVAEPTAAADGSVAH
jgi:hypothetical protein